MNEYVDLLREFGFPVFMVIWFMFRTEKVIEKNTAAWERVAKFFESQEDT